MTQTPSTARKVRTYRMSYVGHMWTIEAFTEVNGDTPATVTLTRATRDGAPVRETVSLTCGYCNKPALWVGKDGGEILCRGCVDDQHDMPTMREIRHLYANITPNTLHLYAR